MDRALKYTLLTLLATVAVAAGCVYGLYLAGARHISPDWQPTTTQYPEAARLALWRSYGGRGLPEGNPMSPPEFAWHFFHAEGAVDPAMRLAGQVGRLAQHVPRVGSMFQYHLTGIAGAIRASNWPVERQIDTMLDTAYFGGEAHGLREGALRVYGQPLDGMDEARIHVLIALMHGPNAFDPWCHADRLRERVFTTARTWNVPASPQQLEAALTTIGPADHRCVIDQQ